MAPSRASAVREGGGEASVGVVQAGLLSREISEIWGVDAIEVSGRQHRRRRYLASCRWAPRGLRTGACTKVPMHENREIRSVPMA
jgi:hypothetical protein